MAYKYVLFDMDGTVLDTLGDLTDSINAALRKFGFPEKSISQCAANLGNGAKVLVKKSAPEGTPQETLDELLAYYKPYYEQHCQIKTAPYPGIMELMSALREEGVKTAIISNKPDEAVQELADQWFKGIVDCAVGEKSGISRKPAPDMVLDCVNKMGASLDECVYVGDTEVDIMTACNAGMDVLMVSWGFRNKDEIREAYCAALPEWKAKNGNLRIADSCEELHNMINIKELT